MTSSPTESLRLELEAPAEARAGSPVPIVLCITNVGDRRIDLYLRGREITFDVVATSETGAVVWRLLADTVVPAILRIETLEPNASLELRATWALETNAGEAVPAGAYTLTGVLHTEGPALHTSGITLRVLSV